MSNINLIILNEQKSKFDQKIDNIRNQHNNLDYLYNTVHKHNLQNNQNQENKQQEKKEPPKLIQLPTSKDIKMARHFEKMANKLTDFSKPLI